MIILGILKYFLKYQMASYPEYLSVGTLVHQHSFFGLKININIWHFQDMRSNAKHWYRILIMWYINLHLLDLYHKLSIAIIIKLSVHTTTQFLMAVLIHLVMNSGHRHWWILAIILIVTILIVRSNLPICKGCIF